MSRGQFLNEFLRLREKLPPMLVLLDLALFVPRREVGAYVSLKKLASGKQMPSKATYCNFLYCNAIRLWLNVTLFWAIWRNWRTKIFSISEHNKFISRTDDGQALRQIYVQIMVKSQAEAYIASLKFNRWTLEVVWSVHGKYVHRGRMATTP
jgi:hypothetical protein